MLKKAVFLALAGALLASPVAAQDLDEVLDNYYEAVGGLDAWQSVQSMRATGKMAMGGMGVEAPFTFVTKRPDKIRLEFTFQGMTGVQAFDGETAWMVMPFMGSTDPEVMPDEMAKQFKDQADIDGPLMGWKESGHQVELIGKEETEGTEAYKIKVTKKDGDVEYYFLDAEYFIPIRVESSTEMQGRMVDIEIILSGYKEVDGLMVAHSVEQRTKGAPSGQVITIEQVELNVDVDDSMFTMPEKEEEEGQQ
ncbi:MAG: outer membrane lipoprotein-sorting protein [Gemmatimonadota bacterium]